MPPKDKMAEVAEFLKDRWNLIGGIAAWLTSIIGGFFRPPPPTTLDEGSAVGPFGQFFLTLVIGLMYIPMYRYRGRVHTRGWVIVAATLVLCAPVLFLVYDHYSRTWTCQYVEHRTLIGSELTASGQAFTAENPEITDEKLVLSYGGNVYKIWTKASIERRRLILNLLYVFSLPCLAAAVIAVLQAGYCGTR